MSFSSFSELFPAFNCAKEDGYLLSIWFGVSIFSSCSLWFLLCSIDSSRLKSGISLGVPSGV